MIDAWVADHLVEAGHMTADLLTKKAKARRCRDCHKPVLAGLDDAGFRTFVDPQPTTTAGEAFALLTGRTSYALDGLELYHRDSGRLAHRPADSTAVFVSHECHSPPLPINEATRRKSYSAEYDQEPPF